MAGDCQTDLRDAGSAARSVVLDALRRRAAGESLPDEQVIASRPELADLLRTELAKLDQICAAGADPGHDVGADAATADMRRARTPDMLRIQCPHCREPFEAARDTPVTEIVCSICGGHFSLADDKAETRAAASLLTLAHFDLVERLGVGGFGSVWKARDRKLDRTVAVKIPHRGTLNNENLEKFLREARAAAQLQHPNIVRVHEVGRDGDTAFIVSDFVRGIPLNDWLTGQQPTIRQAVEICIALADALQHAHDRGVIHRDLKPANILIDGEGRPHLTDFGLARREAGEVTVTMEGQVLGTPAYMSPEQAQGESHTADGRSDIYSLGVVFFELLTGELPFRGNPRMLMHQVIRDEPPSPRKLNSNVPKDLETITLKCLEKDPGRRYQAAHDADTDLTLYLRGEPIVSRPIGRLERGLRWRRRNRSTANALIALIVSLLLGTLFSTWFAVEARVGARVARETAEQLQGELQRNRLMSARLELKASDFRNAYRLLTQPVPPALEQEWQWLAWQYCRESRALERTDLRAILKASEPIPPARTAGWGILERLNGGVVVSVAPYETTPFSIDLEKRRQIKQRHASVTPQFAVALGNGNDLRIIRRLEKGTLGQRVVLLDSAGSELWSLSSPGPAPTSVAANTSNNVAAVGYENGAIQILRYKISSDSAEVLHVDTIRSTNEIIVSLLFDEDGTHLFGLSGDWIVWTWAHSDHGAPDIEVTPTHTNTVRRIVPSHDGRLLVSNSYGGKVHIWNAAARRLLTEINAHPANVPRAGDVAITRDNKLVLTTGYDDAKVRIWDARDGSFVDAIDAADSLSRFQLANDDTELFIANGSQIHHWDLGRRKRLYVFPDEAEAAEFVYALQTIPRAGRLVAVYSASDQTANTARSRRCEIWDTARHSLVAILPDEHQDGLRDVDVSADGRLLAVCSRDGTATVWDLNQQRLLHRLPVKPGNGHANIVSSVCFHPHQPLLVTASHDNRVVFWSTESGRELASIDVDPTGERGYADLGLLKEAVFSPDGSTLYVAVGGEIFWVNMKYYDNAIQVMREERMSDIHRTAVSSLAEAGEW